MISAIHGQDVDLLLDQLVEIIPRYEPPEEVSEDIIRAAIVGRPNVGKSSLLNALLKEERAIVAEAPGTTRDAIDTPFEWGDQQFVLIDTAGIRRKRKVKGFEYYSVIRAFGAIERCDVALCLLDPNEGVTDQDKRIVGYAHEQGRAVILVVNKWDLVKERAAAEAEEDGREVTARRMRTLMADFTTQVRHALVFAEYAPVVFVSALHGEGLNELMETVVDVAEQHSKRVPTPMLNRLVQEATQARSLSFRGRALKVYYATQPQVKPPTFVLFVNNPDYVHFSHRRYLENALRKSLSFEGTPVRMTFREAAGKERQGR
jgi:GTP-binding protein